MQTPFMSRPQANPIKAHTRPNRIHATSPFPNDRPLGFTRRELRHMVAEMIG